jgi:hypothetical protein
MNDLGVSLHSHDGETDFFTAAQRKNAQTGKLLIVPTYLEPNFGWPARIASPVRGVYRTIPKYASEDLKAVADANEPFDGTLEDYARLAAARLMEHLKSHWDATRPTLFVHSSGYDSRILSSCLAALRDEGFDLGRLHFRCRPPEEKSFVEVMRRQGWAPEQYSVFEMPEVDPLDVGAWDRPGVSPWLPVTSQINFWRDVVPYEEEKDWNLVGGSGGGEAVEYPALRKPPTVPWQYCANAPLQRWFGYFPDGTDFAADVEARFAKVLFPYFGEAHVRTIAALPDRFIGFHESGCDNVRAAILATFKDSTLDVPRLPRTYSWSISPGRWEEMRRRYAESIFVREVPGAPAADQLLATMQMNFFTKDSNAERLWRLSSLWEKVRGS